MRGSGAGYFRFLEVAVVLLLLTVGGGELIVYSPPGASVTRTLSVDAAIDSANSQSVTLDLHVQHGRSDRMLRLIALQPGTKTPAERHVSVFYDGAYPTASVSPVVAQDVADNLAGELSIRHYGGQIVTLSAADLAAELRQINAASSQVIVALTGVLPASVYSRGTNLLTPWVQAGGLFIWGGATIGYYAGVKGQPLATAPPTGGPSLGLDGTNALLGPNTATFPWTAGRGAGAASDIGLALDIAYQLTSAGIKSGAALARGGKILGWYTAQFSSVTYLPVGAGGFVIFGGEILDAGAVSRDIARILSSGAIYGSGRIAARDVDLTDVGPSTTIRWTLPFGLTQAGIDFIAFDPAPNAVYYSRRVLAQG
jgi:hypothetical protein